MKAQPIQTSFNGGELSPLIAGRVDVAKYGGGCERLVNFYPTVQGPAVARPGFRYASEVKDSADRTWLMRFEFSTDEAYQVEFGDGYCRFYANRGQVQVLGVPYEIASPYTAAQLTNSEGAFALRWVQTGDVIYIVHGDGAVPVYTLARYAATNWVMAAVEFVPPPFAEQNTSATTIYASATTGLVTLTASSAIFDSSMVGRFVYLQEKDVRDVKQWEAGKSVSAGDIRRSDGKNYVALNAATTGAVRPTHSVGAAYDGDSGVQWEFQDAGFGIAKITAYTNPTHVTAAVIDQLPTGAVLVGNASTRWALDAWNATDGYPTNVTFFRERLVFSRDSKLWFSVSADFTNFSTEIDGVISADAAFDRAIVSDRTNEIRWLSPGDVLLIGTHGDEWAVTEATTSEPFGPNNCKTQRQSTYGSNTVAPVRVGSDTVFVQKAGRKLRAMAFRFEEDGFESPDISVFANHVTRSGIVDIAFQQEPTPIIWAARTDGTLIGCTFDRAQDVVGWHRHPMVGGIVECVETIPSPNGGRDDLWIIARYAINGATKRYVAYLADEDDEDTDQADWIYSDMASTYDGAPATTISGLDYLEGKEAWVLCDGARHPNRTVTGGAITLQFPGSKVTVGLPCDGYVETMNLEAGGNAGTAQGKIKRGNKATLRVYRSLGGRVGTAEANLTEMIYRSPSVPMGSPPVPYTGDVTVGLDGGYDSRLTVIVKKDRPMPMTVLAVMPELVTYG